MTTTPDKPAPRRRSGGKGTVRERSRRFVAEARADGKVRLQAWVDAASVARLDAIATARGCAGRGDTLDAILNEASERPPA